MPTLTYVEAEVDLLSNYLIHMTLTDVEQRAISSPTTLHMPTLTDVEADVHLLIQYLIHV